LAGVFRPIPARIRRLAGSPTILSPAATVAAAATLYLPDWTEGPEEPCRPGFSSGDILVGDDGNDKIFGQQGEDGHDAVNGGPDTDRCVEGEVVTACKG
jgi:Ca2+-binding RTX toxin-like protein